MDRLTVSEYGVRYFSHFEKIKDKDNFYELEYILYGKKTDRENLEASVLKTGFCTPGIEYDPYIIRWKKNVRKQKRWQRL